MWLNDWMNEGNVRRKNMMDDESIESMISRRTYEWARESMIISKKRENILFLSGWRSIVFFRR